MSLVAHQEYIVSPQKDKPTHPGTKIIIQRQNVLELPTSYRSSYVQPDQLPDVLVSSNMSEYTPIREVNHMGILTNEMKRVVRQQRMGFIATVCPDGSPNLSPKGTVSVWDDDHLVFADIASPTTISNLTANPAFEVNVLDAFIRKGYRFKGTASLITSGELFDLIKHCFETGSNGIHKSLLPTSRYVLLLIQEARQFISPAYTSDTTETSMRAQWSDYWTDVQAENS